MSLIVLENATVLDVVSGDLAPDQTIVIENEFIVSTGSERHAGANAIHINLAGRTVLPGLCDAHVHVTSCSTSFAAIEGLSPVYVAAHAAKTLKEMLNRGFTTVRDAGGADHGLAQAVQEGLFSGPRLLFCGKAISQTGGHGDMRLAGEHHVTQCGCCAGLGVVCDGPTEVRRACRDMIRQGATHIKLMMSGGVSSPTDRITNTQLADDEAVAAVKEADAAGIYCMAHAYESRAITRALHAGVRSIEHGNLIDQPTLQLLRQKNAFLVPTLVTYDVLAREGKDSGLASTMLAKLTEVADAGRRALELANREEVKIAFGTDLLAHMHCNQLEEFSIRTEIQKPIDVIRSATIIAASLFQMTDKIGNISVGAYADVIAVDGNPAEDISYLTRPDKNLHLIIANGKIIKNTCRTN